MRCFYTSVAITKMLYAADLFLFPESNTKEGTKGFISKLAKIQRQASIHITSVMKTSPTDVADVCADILPISLLVERVMFGAASRLATLHHPTH